MKILFVCQYYYPERIGLTDICEELVKRKYDVTVLTGLPNYPEGHVPKEYRFFRKRNETINGVKVKRCFEIGRRKGKMFLCLNYLSFMISSSFKVLFMGKSFDKVFCYQHSPVTMGIPAVIYKKLHKKELILYSFDLWPESLKTFNIKEDSMVFKIIKKVSNYVYINCDKILISSKPFEKYMMDTFKISKEKLSYLPQHSIDFGLKYDSYNDDKTHFLFAGNLGKTQNAECIIEAANLIKNNKKFIIDIVGYGSDYDNLVKLTKDLELDDIVLFHGRKKSEEMNEFYNKADVMLITLKGGTFVSKTLPLKLQSYMSTGKPILGSIEGAAEEIINETNCGMVCSPDDSKKLSENMLEYMKNKDKYMLNGKNGRTYFENNFKFEQNINKIIKELK